MGTQPPEWPERVEVVEVTPLHLEPGDTLVVKAKDGAPQFGPAVAQELAEYLQYVLPDVRIVVVGLPLDLDVIKPAAESEA